MGERTDEVGSHNNYGAADDRFVVVAGGERNVTSTNDGEPSVEVIERDIEQTRSEMSETINAIQNKLNPQQMMDQAKDTAVKAATELMEQAKESAKEAVDHAKEAATETASILMVQAKEAAGETASTLIVQAKEVTTETASKLMTQAKEAANEAVDHAKQSATDAVDHAKQGVHDATIGKVEHMVSNVTDTGSGIVDMIKANPIPAALAGLGLGWLFLNRQNKGTSNSGQYDNRGNYPVGQPDYRRTGTSNLYNNSRSSYPTTSQNMKGSEGLTDQLMNTVRQNPVPAAVAGLTLGYLATRGGSGQSASTRSSYPGYSTGYEGYGHESSGLGDKMGDFADEAKNKVGDLASGVKDTAGGIASGTGDLIGQAGDKVGDIASGTGDLIGQAGDKVGDIASTAGEKVGDLVGLAGDAVGGIGEGVQYQAERAKSQFETLLDENPLALGAMALVLGAAVGLMLPKTAQEDQLMGEARDNLIGKAQEVAQETIEKVQGVAEEVQETAKTEARNQGLTV